MNRAGECQYDDNTVKSRTQKLLEKLSQLEARLRELESENANAQASGSSQGASSTSSPESDASPPPAFPSAINALDMDDAQLAAPYAFSQSQWAQSTPSSSSSSVDLATASAVHGATMPDMTWLSSSHLSAEGANNPGFAFGVIPQPSDALPRWDPKTPLPQEHKSTLLKVFYSHRHQLWFDGDITRFDEALAQTMFLTPPHDCLLNAMYLLGCHFARSPYYSELETIFFNKTLNHITAALDASDRLVDVIEASCLLAVYLYINCRFLEGYCHAFSAARLAVGLGLHQLISGQSSPPIPIPPPQTEDEMRHRVSAFWQVFIVDRCWTIANGLPLALPDGDSNHARIKTPWPAPMPHDPVDPGNYIPALRAKSVALLERSGRISSATTRDEEYWTQHNSAEIALKRLLASLPMFVGFDPWRVQAPFVDVDLFSIHTFVHVATIHLYKDINQEEALKALRTVLSYIRQLTDPDWEYLDPTMSAVWTCAARAYIGMVAQAMTMGAHAYSLAVAEQDLDVLCNAMHAMSAYFPIAGEHAKKIEQERLSLRSAAIL